MVRPALPANRETYFTAILFPSVQRPGYILLQFPSPACCSIEVKRQQLTKATCHHIDQGKKSRLSQFKKKKKGKKKNLYVNIEEHKQQGCLFLRLDEQTRDLETCNLFCSAQKIVLHRLLCAIQKEHIGVNS